MHHHVPSQFSWSLPHLIHWSIVIFQHNLQAYCCISYICAQVETCSSEIMLFVYAATHEQPFPLLHCCLISRTPPSVASAPYHLLLGVNLQNINATLHNTCWTQEFLQNIHWELLKHPRCCLGSWSSPWEVAISMVMRMCKGWCFLT